MDKSCFQIRILWQWINHALFLDTSFRLVNWFSSRFKRYFSILLRINGVMDSHNKHKNIINILMIRHKINTNTITWDLYLTTSTRTIIGLDPHSPVNTQQPLKIMEEGRLNLETLMWKVSEIEFVLPHSRLAQQSDTRCNWFLLQTNSSSTPIPSSCTSIG